MSTQALEQFLPERSASRRAFAKAAASLAAAGVVHERARETLIGRLEYARLSPSLIVDLGTGPGAATAPLAERFERAGIVAIDSSARMCAAAAGAYPHARVVCADAERLPLADSSVDLLFANLVMPWCRPDALLGEAARVLTQEGLLLFSTLGPDTLAAVRRAWAAHDGVMHVHAFFDMHDLGDLALAAGLTEPVVDVERVELSYAGLPSLVEDLRACGAVNTAGGRRRSLTGPRRWRAFADRLEREAARGDGRLHVGIELVYGQAWGRVPRSAAPDGPGETAVPVASIRRR